MFNSIIFPVDIETRQTRNWTGLQSERDTFESYRCWIWFLCLIERKKEKSRIRIQYRECVITHRNVSQSMLLIVTLLSAAGTLMVTGAVTCHGGWLVALPKLILVFISIPVNLLIRPQPFIHRDWHSTIVSSHPWETVMCQCGSLCRFWGTRVYTHFVRDCVKSSTW